MYICCFVFFFKQKTAYEMRISDWSSDVCSSDLAGEASPAALGVVQVVHPGVHLGRVGEHPHHALLVQVRRRDGAVAATDAASRERDLLRSEERRVGKEGVSTFRSRWSPSH